MYVQNKGKKNKSFSYLFLFISGGIEDNISVHNQEPI